MIKILLYIGITQTFFGAFAIFTKKEENLTNTLLGIWLFFMGVTLLSMLGDFYPETNLHRLQYLMLSPSFGPFLLLYTRASIKKNIRFRQKDLLHFTPSIILSFIALIFVEQPPFSDKLLRPIHLWIFGFPIIAITIVYIIIVGKILKKHKNYIKNYFSYSSEKLTLNWLRYIYYAFFIGFLLTVIFTTYLMIYGDLSFDPRVFIVFSYVKIAYAFSYFAIIQPNTFQKKETSPEADVEQMDSLKKIIIQEKNSAINDKENRYGKSGLKEEDAVLYEKKLLNYMQEKEAYLNGELTIQDVSDATEIPKHHITQVLNERLNKNFYTFVNEYRVEKVKELLSNQKFNQFTILAIGYEAGFNSKSSYYNSFKKIEGITPSEYRKDKVL